MKIQALVRKCPKLNPSKEQQEQIALISRAAMNFLQKRGHPMWVLERLQVFEKRWALQAQSKKRQLREGRTGCGKELGSA